MVDYPTAFNWQVIPGKKIAHVFKSNCNGWPECGADTSLPRDVMPRRLAEWGKVRPCKRCLKTVFNAYHPEA